MNDVDVVDVVDHGILVSKLSRLNIPPCILHWISCFLTGRTQQVKYATKLSVFQPINIGIVQGSGLGPKLYIVMESDLKTISKINILFKYADDNNLLVPEKTDTDICVEFANCYDIVLICINYCRACLLRNVYCRDIN